MVIIELLLFDQTKNARVFKDIEMPLLKKHSIIQIAQLAITCFNNFPHFLDTKRKPLPMWLLILEIKSSSRGSWFT